MHVPKVESWSESHEHTNVKREIMVTQSFCWQEMLKQEEKKKKKTLQEGGKGNIPEPNKCYQFKHM